MKKRVFSVLLSLCLMLSLAPALSGTAEAAGAQDLQFKSFLEPGEPDGYDKSTTEDPYMEGQDNNFLLTAQNELLLNTQWSSTEKTAMVGDTYNKPANYTADGDTLLTDVQLKDTASYKNGTKTLTSTNQVTAAYVASAAFDPTGSGRKDHVAYVGLDTVNKKIVVWVLDAKNDLSWGPVALNDTKITDDWIKLSQYAGRAFFSITAGDYDGDHKDSFVVYSPGANTVDPQLYEFSLQNGEYVKNSNEIDVFDKGLSAAAGLKGKDPSPQGTTGYVNMITMSLASGDFDGDGTDELAAAAGTYRLSDTSSTSAAFYATRVSVLKQSGGVFASKMHADLAEEDSGTYTLLYAGAISAGDVNADGQDEIVVTGYTGQATYSGSKWSKLYERDTSNLASATVVCSGADTYSCSGLNLVAPNNFTKAHAAKVANNSDGDLVWAMVTPCCVTMNGDAAADYVFLSGTLYEWKSGGLSALYTPTYFSSGYLNYENGVSAAPDMQYAWVDTAISGDFDGNEMGRQQLVFTVCSRQAMDGSVIKAPSDNYQYQLGVIGCTYDDTEDAIGGISKYYVSEMGGLPYSAATPAAVKTGLQSNAWWDKSTQVLNCLPTAVDTDDDGVMAKYIKKTYTYTDPSVMTVLQAAPYFGDLGDYSDFASGQTSYSVTTSYTYAKSKSNNVSFGFGLSLDVGNSVYKVSLEAGYTMNWSETFENSLTTSYTMSFNAADYDQVILERTPVVVYVYEVAKDGKWTDSEGKNYYYQISVPQQPIYQSLSVDEYNSFTDYFDNWYSHKLTAAGKTDDTKTVLLKKLDSTCLPLNNEGNPSAYRSNWTSSGDEAQSLSKGTYEVGHSSGSITSSWQLQSSSQNSVSISHGFHFSLTTTFGIDAWNFGPYVNLDYSHGTGHYTTDTAAQGASGTVANINSPKLLSTKGIPTSVSEAYGFNWSFGMWEHDLGGIKIDFAGVKDVNGKTLYDGKVPFFGYAVWGITMPPSPVTDLTAELDSSASAKLTWSEPEANGNTITGYEVFQLMSDGTYESKGTTTGLTYTVTPLSSSNTNYTFVVAARYNGGSDIGMYSNKASVTTPKKFYALTLAGNADITAAANGADITCTGKCPEDTLVYVSATAWDGYAITGYTITPVGGAAASHALMNCAQADFSLRFPAADAKVEILTQRVRSAITFSAEGNGTVSASAGGSDLKSGGTVTTAVSFSAAPDSGCVLSQWSVTDADGNQQLYTSDGTNKLALNPVSSQYTVIAKFVDSSDPAVNKTITVTTPEHGRIEAVNESGAALVPVNGKITVPVNSKLTFTAVPSALWSFSNWTGDLSGTQTVKSVSVTKDMTVSAEFSAPILYSVNLTATTGGALTAADGDGNEIKSADLVPAGTVVALTAVPLTGYAVSGWTVDGTAVTASAASGATDGSQKYMISSLSGNTNVAVSFSRPTLTYATPEHGTLTVVDAFGNSIASGSEVALGTVITVTAVPETGYVLGTLTINGRSVSSGATHKITGNTTIAAAFTTQSSTPGGTGGGGTAGGGTAGSKAEYTLTFDTTGGSAIAAITKAGGTVVDLSSFKPTRESFAFAGWYADETLTKAVTSVEMKADTTVYAKWNWVNPFTDVKEGDYFYGAVKWAAGSGVTGGVTPTGFAPDMTCTRAQAVTFLWRAAGSPAPKTTVMPFTDVPKDSYYYSAVLWAVENGIVKGTSDTTFSPDLDCSRAQIMTFLWRANGSKSGTAANPFVDVGSSDYYYDAVLWAVTNNITVGTSANTYSPGGDCTRAQIVTFIYRELEKQNTK